MQISDRWADLWNGMTGVREDELLMTKKRNIKSFGDEEADFFVALTAPPD